MKKNRLKSTVKRAGRLKKRDPKKGLELLSAFGQNSSKKLVTGTRATCYLSLREFEKAEQAARKRFSMGKDFWGYAQLIHVLITCGKAEEAEPIARDFLKYEKNDTSLRLLGLSLMAQGKQVEAEPYFREMLRYKTSNRTLGLLTDNLRKQKKYTEAISILEEIGAQKDHNNYLCQAFCEMHLGLFQESYQSFLGAECAMISLPRDAHFNVFLRLYMGYVFLYSRASKKSANVLDLLDKALSAAQHLKKVDPDTIIGRVQKKDYQGAIALANSMFFENP